MFDFELIMLPIHKCGVHWALVIIDVAKKRIEHYDSMGGRWPKKYFARVLWWVLESAVNCKVAVKTEGWTFVDMERAAMQQTNDSDCGVYTFLHAFLRVVGVAPTNAGGADNFTPNDVICVRRFLLAQLLRQWATRSNHCGRDLAPY
jgi:Ulp1 family protease